MGKHDCVSKSILINLVKRAYIMGLNNCTMSEVETMLKEKMDNDKWVCFPTSRGYVTFKKGKEVLWKMNIKSESSIVEVD